MWGWLNSLVDGLQAVWESITNIPSLIWNWFKTGFETIYGWLSNILDSILELPTFILDGIKDIFVPDPEEIELMFNESIESIKSKFGFQEFHLDSLGSSSSKPSDIEASYSIYGIGSVSTKFFDTTYLIKGVEYFRPFIRGFIVLLLLFYNYKMFLSFIGHDLGAVTYSAAKSDKGD